MPGVINSSIKLMFSFNFNFIKIQTQCTKSGLTLSQSANPALKQLIQTLAKNVLKMPQLPCSHYTQGCAIPSVMHVVEVSGSENSPEFKTSSTTNLICDLNFFISAILSVKWE